MVQTSLPALRMCKRCLEPHQSMYMLDLLTARLSLNTQHRSKALEMLTTLKCQPAVTYLPQVSNVRPPPALLEQRSPQAIAHLMRTLCSDSETFCLCGRSLWNHRTRNSAFNSTSGGELARQSERTLQAVLRVAKPVQAIQRASAVRSESTNACESCAQRASNQPATRRKLRLVCLSWASACPELSDRVCRLVVQIS